TPVRQHDSSRNTPVRQLDSIENSHNLNSSPATVTSLNSLNGSASRRRLVFIRRSAAINENPEHLAQDPSSDPLRALLDEEDGIMSTRLPLYEDNENGNLDELPAQIKEVKKFFEDFLLNFKLQYRKEKENLTVTDMDKEFFYQYYMRK
ncbi:13344_t:CDS:2, partial [Racocetra fulgida]